MMRIGLVFKDLFQSLDPANLELSGRALERILECCTGNAEDYLHTHPETPNLFALGRQGVVRYVQEPAGVEDFCDIPTIIANGGGDCDDLAPWRAAEIRVRSNIHARCHFVWKMEPSKWRGGDVGQLYHIKVEYPDGRVEDPCVRLGMHKVLGRGQSLGAPAPKPRRRPTGSPGRLLSERPAEESFASPPGR